MFNIHTVNGVKFNVPLESLRSDEIVNRIPKGHRARNIIDSNRGRHDESGDEKLSLAIEAYKESVKMTNEREPVLHAYTIMKSPVITLDPDMDIAGAWDFFQEKKVSYMPVLSREKKLTGIVSDRDLLKCLCITRAADKDNTCEIVSDIMTDKVLTAGRVTDIRRIAKAMFEHHIGAMPIVDESGELCGIITRSDILYALITYPSLSLWV